MTGSIAGGRLADRLGPRRVATSSLLAIAVLELALAAGHSATAVLVAGLGVLALVGYMCFPSHQARLIARYPERSGSILAWNNSALYAGILGGSALAGVVLSAAGFSAVLVLCALLAIAGASASALWAMPATPAPAN